MDVWRRTKCLLIASGEYSGAYIIVVSQELRHPQKAGGGEAAIMWDNVSLASQSE